MGMTCHDCRKRELDKLAEIIYPVKGSEWWTARELLDTLDLVSDWVPFQLADKVEEDRDRGVKSLGRYLTQHKQNAARGDTLILETWESSSRASYYRLQPFHESRYTRGVS